MSLMASLVTTSRMQQCFNVITDIYHESLLLFYCCVLLEIKLITTTTAGVFLIGSKHFHTRSSTLIYRLCSTRRDTSNREMKVYTRRPTSCWKSRRIWFGHRPKFCSNFDITTLGTIRSGQPWEILTNKTRSVLERRMNNVKKVNESLIDAKPIITKPTISFKKHKRTVV